MRSFFLLLGLLILWSCNEEVPRSCIDGIKNGLEEGIDCGGDCLRACPTCSDGFKNGTEIEVDCGGECPVCSTCSTQACSYLSGVDKRTWRVAAIDSAGFPVPSSRWPEIFDCFFNLRLCCMNDIAVTYQANGVVNWVCGSNFSFGSWKFDNQENPDQLLETYMARFGERTETWPIIELNQDVMRYGQDPGNQGLAWEITWVPDN